MDAESLLVDAWFGRVSARRPTYFLLLRQKKVSKEKASRRPDPFGVLCAARCPGEVRKLVRFAAFEHANFLSPRPCAAQSGLTAKEREPKPFWLCRGAQRRADQGCACLSEASLRRPRPTRAPQVARSEAEGHSQQGRLSFGYFSLAKQRKVARLPGRDPACHADQCVTGQSK